MQNPLGEINQFVSEVIAFSTEFGHENWSASKVRGPPSTLNIYGDSPQSWCPATYNQVEFLEVKFERPVYATSFKIYENLNGGSVVKIEAHDGNCYHTLWSRLQPEHIMHYNIFNLVFGKSTIRTNRYRITFRCTAANYYSEIDAIEVIGTLTSIQVPDKTIGVDMVKLLDDERYADMEIKFIDESERFNVHKCILAIRTQTLFDSLIKNEDFIYELNSDQFALVLDFVYTDKLNEAKLRQIIEIEKIKETEAATEAEAETANATAKTSLVDQDKWMLLINRLIRFCIKYKLRRLEFLLVNYLLQKFLNEENVLNVLVDASSGSVESNDCLAFCFDGPQITDIRLNNVEFVCFEFIKLNLTKIISLPKINLLPKEILLNILKNIA